jgi:AraC-like DNA-binding protein
VHINENYFSQFIHKSGYGSFSNLIGYIRCNSAQFLLLSSELSVVEISDRCGFSDVKYFYKHFKQIYKKTPSEFRRWFAGYIKNPERVYHYTAEEILPFLEPFTAEYFSECVLKDRF